MRLSDEMNGENAIYSHYTCDQNFEAIAVIAVRHNGLTKSWASEKIGEHAAVAGYWQYLLDNPDSTLLHWNMDSPKYGFAALQERYKVLSNAVLPDLPNQHCNIAAILCEKYGDKYIDKGYPGRLINLCNLNKIRLEGNHLSTELKPLQDAVWSRVKAIETIFTLDRKGELQYNRLLLEESRKEKRNINNSLDKITLADYFDHLSKYKAIMDLLVEKGHCQSGTHVWIDTRPGYKNTVVALIKRLHAQGFYKMNTPPASKDVVSIALNTFGVNLGIDTVKSTKASKYFDFIRPASTYNG